MTNKNYLTGAAGMQFHSFFAFDLSGVTGPFSAAQLSLFNPLNGYDGLNANATETLTIYDFSSSIPTLLNGTGGLGAYNDLGSGTVLGTTTVSAANNNSFVTVNLNAAGVAAFNAAGTGQIVLGGSLGSSPGGFVFGFSGAESTGVDLTPGGPVAAAPAPPTLLAGLFGIGVAGLGGVVRRLRRR